MYGPVPKLSRKQQLHSCTQKPMMAAKRRPQPPPPGIYEIGGTIEGRGCLIAYDDDGEFTILTVMNPDDDTFERIELERWLHDRGVRLPRALPGLYLA